jgi:hypothetical protein
MQGSGGGRIWWEAKRGGARLRLSDGREGGYGGRQGLKGNVEA